MRRRIPHRTKPSASMMIEPAPFSWSYLLITIIGAVAVAAGLFFAATRHFSAMELGITNAKLRSQLQELQNEKRRLDLEREIALTPAELRKTARSLGLREQPMVVRSEQPDVTELAKADTELKRDMQAERVSTTETVNLTKPESKAFRKPDADRTEVAQTKRDSPPAKQNGRSDKVVEATLDVRPRIAVTKESNDKKQKVQIAKTSTSAPVRARTVQPVLIKY